MTVQTSSVTTAANGNLSLTPNGTGGIVASPLSGSGNRPVKVNNAGLMSLFSPSDLTAGTPTATDVVMVDIGGVPRKTDLQGLVNVTDAINLTDLSVTTASTGTATGGLAYNNATGVFTYTPVSAAASGGIALTDLSVTTASTKTQSGALAYNNTTGEFTYTPVEYNNGTASLTGLTLTGPTFKINLPSLPDR